MKTLALAGAVLVSALPAAAQEPNPPLNDLEIAHVAYNAGAIDIRYAHLALALSDDADVRDFAQLMIRDHTAVNGAAEELIAELDVAPQDNPMSRALLEGAAQQRAEMAALAGHAFDCAYATNELHYHRLVNRTVAEDFIPNVTVEPLRELLAGALQTFRVHEGHAESMVESLAC